VIEWSDSFVEEKKMAAQNLEARVTALEEEVARLKDQLKKAPVRSWQSIVGTFPNDPLYDKAMEYGRKYRESLRPKGKKTKNIKRKRADGRS
jgi:hypothetical protein